jgi:hypothetical protein
MQHGSMVAWKGGGKTGMGLTDSLRVCLFACLRGNFYFSMAFLWAREREYPRKY